MRMVNTADVKVILIKYQNDKKQSGQVFTSSENLFSKASFSMSHLLTYFIC